MESPYDEWSKNIHAVITFLKPFFDDWRSYASLVSALMGVGVLIMENQVLLRMRMGHWEILGYVLSLLPPPVAANYRIMGVVCVTASFLTLTSNVLYMLRGWEEPLPFYDWASSGIRWMTSQIWYAIGMIFLFHVVTRPAQSGVVLFGKFPRDLWAFKWYLCILYLPVRYMLLELCDIHRNSKHILIPLEIFVDVVLYNGPFLTILLRLLYLGWKVAYDEAVLTGAIFEDDSSVPESPVLSIGSFFFSDSSNSTSRTSPSRPGSNGYVGLSLVDLDEAEQGQSRAVIRAEGGRNSHAKVNSNSKPKSSQGDKADKRNSSNHHHGNPPPAYESRDYSPKSLAPKMSPKASPRGSSRTSPRTLPKTSSPLRNVVFSIESTDDEDENDDSSENICQESSSR
ncbi:hypothetical protein BGX27_011608 [Mortierella sp. AM989]|nr:hypothetical protein BGX27_011608 [Mortierella sp. AM989]